VGPPKTEEGVRSPHIIERTGEKDTEGLYRRAIITVVQRLLSGGR
jgi:hypothetical protein